MDALTALRAEIAKKKKNIPGGPSTTSKNRVSSRKRWRTKADLEREREAAYLAEEKAEAEKLAKKRKRKLTDQQIGSDTKLSAKSQQTESPAKKNKPDEKQHSANNDFPDTSTNHVGEPPLAKPEVCKRLRALKEPITLFGETLWNRFDRLRNLELAQEEGTGGQRNIFQKKLREMEAKDAEDEIYHYAGAKLPHLESKTEDQNDLHNKALDQEDEPKCREDFVHMNIRKYMRLWKSEIDTMSTEERKSVKGRSLGATYEQTKEWLRPLEKFLRKRKLSRNILEALRAIFDAAERREYVRANTLYLERLAIGNAPWPMGATMVGIHARAAREKIGEDKIAHVMNDEQTRKYIQAIKRLLTVAQRHFPTTYSKMIL